MEEVFLRNQASSSIEDMEISIEALWLSSRDPLFSKGRMLPEAVLKGPAAFSS